MNKETSPQKEDNYLPYKNPMWEKLQKPKVLFYLVVKRCTILASFNGSQILFIWTIMLPTTSNMTYMIFYSQPKKISLFSHSFSQLKHSLYNTHKTPSKYLFLYILKHLENKNNGYNNIWDSQYVKNHLILTKDQIITFFVSLIQKHTPK